MLVETFQSQAGTPQEEALPHSPPPKKRTRDESIEREEEILLTCGKKTN